MKDTGLLFVGLSMIAFGVLLAIVMVVMWWQHSQGKATYSKMVWTVLGGILIASLAFGAAALFIAQGQLLVDGGKFDDKLMTSPLDIVKNIAEKIATSLATKTQ